MKCRGLWHIVWFFAVCKRTCLGCSSLQRVNINRVNRSPFTKYMRTSKFMINVTKNEIFILELGPEVIKLVSCSIKLRTKFIKLLIVKILTIISMINITLNSLKARKVFIFQILVLLVVEIS